MGNPLLFEVKVTAMGEVRDAEGNLVSSTPVEGTMELTADQLTELDLPVPPHPDQENK